ncbi:MAG: protein phosphatase 2C domain-containing protein [Candidatus Saccharibacteria bacterium]|nr:protein phosphatase 2C domain-containing protein [Pseudorhodobacter sp.]
MPGDRSAPNSKPDQDFGRTEGDLLCVAASLRGRSHAREGGFRDDDFCLSADRQGGWHIATVADGAGSAKFSRHGAHLATKTVLNQLPGLLADIVTPGLDQLLDPYLQGHPDAGPQIKAQLQYRSLVTVAFNAFKTIETEAAQRGVPTSAYSTTLLIAVARKIRDDLWFIASFGIGDGGIAVFDAQDGNLRPLSRPDSGDYAGQTRFCTNPNLPAMIRSNAACPLTCAKTLPPSP